MHERVAQAARGEHVQRGADVLARRVVGAEQLAQHHLRAGVGMGQQPVGGGIQCHLHLAAGAQGDDGEFGRIDVLCMVQARDGSLRGVGDEAGGRERAGLREHSAQAAVLPGPGRPLQRRDVPQGRRGRERQARSRLRQVSIVARRLAREILGSQGLARQHARDALRADAQHGQRLGLRHRVREYPVRHGLGRRQQPIALHRRRIDARCLHQRRQVEPRRIGEPLAAGPWRRAQHRGQLLGRGEVGHLSTNGASRSASRSTSLARMGCSWSKCSRPSSFQLPALRSTRLGMRCLGS